jgi:hypothetical protein
MSALTGTRYRGCWSRVWPIRRFSSVAKRYNLGSEMPLARSVAALTALSTSDVIALGAIVLAVVGAVLTYRQLRAGKNTARAQFLLDMDQAFEADNDIRVRLAKRDKSPLTPDEWRQVKRYMARFERVSVFVSEGLLDPEVVYRLYRARFRNIVKNDQIRARLLEGDKATSWVDFIELWRKLDAMEVKASGSHLWPDADPPSTPRSTGQGRVVATEEFEDEAGTR